MLEAGIAYFKKENLFALHCMSLINEMLYLFFNHVPATDFRSTTSQSYKLRMERLKRLLTYIDERYTERLTIAELAQTRTSVCLPSVPLFSGNAADALSDVSGAKNDSAAPVSCSPTLPAQ